MSRISETPKGVLETYDWEDVAEDLKERIDKTIELVNSLIIFWKKYTPDNTMEIRQLENILSVIKGEKKC